jgi:hypothetical protein
VGCQVVRPVAFGTPERARDRSLTGSSLSPKKMEVGSRSTSSRSVWTLRVGSTRS